MPAPIDPGKSMGEYLFGKDFSYSYQGITDPELQDRLIGAESEYRPRYTALELADIGTMAYGIEEGAPNEQRLKLEAELAGLKAGNLVDGSFPSYEEFEEKHQALLKESHKGFAGFLLPAFGPMMSKSEYQVRKAEYDRDEALGISKDGRSSRAARIAQIETQLTQMPETMKGTPGLFQMLEDQASRAGALQREQLGLQRESDVGALREFAPQVVQAYRDADPYSTALAEKATANAVMKAASSAERALQSSGLDNLNAKREAASAAEQELNKVGMSLSDLSPTEQEAILSGQGMEFASSTGELSALEKRRAQQSSREASVARGRGMDQSAVYGEMEARMAEELNKREREIALGAGLLGQQSEMRLNRLGKGAGILGQAEAMDAQRRADQLQRQQFGASSLGQAEAMNTQRRLDYRQNLAQAFDMNRALAGDVGMTILGRPSSSIGLATARTGRYVPGNAGSG